MLQCLWGWGDHHQYHHSHCVNSVSVRWIKTVHRRHAQVQCCTRNPQLDLEEEEVASSLFHLQGPPSRHISHHLLQLQVVAVEWQQVFLSAWIISKNKTVGLLLQDLIPLSACSDPSTWRLTPYASYLLWGRCLFISVSVSACIEKESTQSCCPGNDFEETHKVQYYWSRLQSIIIIISNLVDCVCVYVEWILFLFLANQYQESVNGIFLRLLYVDANDLFIAPRGKVHVRRAHRKLEWLGGVLLYIRLNLAEGDNQQSRCDTKRGYPRPRVAWSCVQVEFVSIT